MSEKATADGLCPVCGTRCPASGESFCEVCGTLIDWGTGDTSETASGPAQPERSDKEPAAKASAELRSGTPGRQFSSSAQGGPSSAAVSAGSAEAGAGADSARAAAGVDGSGSARPGGRPDSAAGGTGEAGGVGKNRPGTRNEPATSSPGTGPGEQASASTAPADTREGMKRARALLVPVPEADDVEEGVPAVLPGRPVPQRPNVRLATADDESGIICPTCRLENRSDRGFCRNDGTPLDCVGLRSATAPRLRPDWTRRIPWRRVLIIAGIVCLVVCGALLTPVVVRNVNDHFSDPAPLPPAAVSASNSDAAHPARSAFDGVSNSWWGTGYNGDSAGQYLQANYRQPVKIEKMIIIPGVSERAEARSQARPKDIDVQLTDSQGRTSTTHCRLADGGAQVIDVAMDGVVQVDMIMRSAYGVAQDKQVAIAEVEVFGRS